MMAPRDILLELFRTAVAAVQPAGCLPPALPQPPRGRTVVIGAGKASAAMAAQLEAHWPGELQGAVVTRYGHAVPCKRIRVLEAGHPFPDQNSVLAAQEMRRLLTGLMADDLVISLMSGGGSALLVEPVPGIALADKRHVSQELMRVGATIRELNRVRQALSQVKGGRLATAAFPAKVVTLVMSDIPGDDPAWVASGPTVPPSEDSDAPLDIVDRLGANLPEHVRKVLASSAPQAADFSHCETKLIATAMQSLEAAAARARELGITPLILSDCIEGEARETAQVHAGIVQGVIRHGTPVKTPAVLLSGGETKVTLGAGRIGRGGRNTEFLLALGLALHEEKSVYAIACDTDGIDGSEDNAGAIWLPDSMERAHAAHLDLRDCLRRHDAYSAFAALSDLVVTGPTQTNVNDFRAILMI
jgi:hydroxypyruvate reductase